MNSVYMLGLITIIVCCISACLLLAVADAERTEKETRELKKELAKLKEETERIKYIASIKKNK